MWLSAEMAEDIKRGGRQRMYYKELNNKRMMPQLGIGGFAQNKEGIRWALESGYRLIDTAAQYGNETEVGAAIRESGVSREEIFLTTKLWTQDIRQGRTYEAFQESLERLQMDYVDLYLIHWPAEGYEDAWKVMEGLYREGKARAIGVSNFHICHLDKLKEVAEVVPSVNQIESHPYFCNQELVDFCMGQGMAVEAWCPLGGAGSRLLEDEKLIKMSEKYGKTAAQIVIRWHIQRGIIVFPKSARRERMKSNLDVFDFVLSQGDMDLIFGMDKNRRSGANPEHFDF